MSIFDTLFFLLSHIINDSHPRNICRVGVHTLMLIVAIYTAMLQYMYILWTMPGYGQVFCSGWVFQINTSFCSHLWYIHTCSQLNTKKYFILFCYPVQVSALSSIGFLYLAHQHSPEKKMQIWGVNCFLSFFMWFSFHLSMLYIQGLGSNATPGFTFCTTCNFYYLRIV